MADAPRLAAFPFAYSGSQIGRTRASETQPQPTALNKVLGVQPLFTREPLVPEDLDFRDPASFSGSQIKQMTS